MGGVEGDLVDTGAVGGVLDEARRVGVGEGGLPVEVSRGELAELGEEGFDAGAVRRGQDAVEEGAQGGVAVGVVQGDFQV